MIVGKTYHFDAAHYISGHETCGKLHGHTWTLTVEIEGDIDPNTRMVIDFHKLNSIVKDYILLPFDHSIINDKVPQDFYPTAETLAILFAYYLEDPLFAYPNIHIILVRLQEGQGGWAEHISCKNTDLKEKSNA